MSSLTDEVVILCWNTPATLDRNAQEIAALLGAEATFVSLTAEGLSRDGWTKWVPKCECLIVDAETLAKVSEAMHDDCTPLLSLTELADHVFIYGFQPTVRHNTLLRTLSRGGLIEVRPIEDRHAKFHVAGGHREWCFQFSGLSFGKPDPAIENSFVESSDAGRQTVLIWAGEAPFLVLAKHGRSQVFFVAGRELINLNEQVSREVSCLDWFSRFVPLAMFLRGALGDQIWHNDHPQACFIIDDPLLKKRYGFLEYKRLVEMMRHHSFSTCIAFIPWNYRRSSNRVGEFFSSKGVMPSLCVHGCDHTAAEFATTEVESLRSKAQLALQRMQEHQLISGVAFDDVMVFPQGLFSAEAVAALKKVG
jgi:hypothetical protein